MNKSNARNDMGRSNDTWRFFSNPLVGLTGTVISVVGVLLAVYFYFQSAKYRDFVYMVNPAKAVVVKSGQASRLKVLVGSKELRGDVTAAQFAFWNQGKESIRAADVLQPVVIEADPPVAILEATVRKQSREIICIVIDERAAAEGKLLLSWNILEGGDGAVVQLVYAGGPDVRFAAHGVIEGQRSLREVKSLGLPRYLLWLCLGVGFVFLFATVWDFLTERGRLYSRKKLIFVGGIGLAILYLLFSIYLIWRSQISEPPFGF